MPYAILPLVVLFVAVSWAQKLEPKLIQWGHTATLLRDGRVLLAGGTCEIAVRNCGHSAQIYNPKTREFSLVGPMLASRWQHSATLLPDGRVLLAGGVGMQVGEPDAEIFDPETGAFTAAGKMHRWRRGHSGTLLPSGKVLLSGISPETYDFVTDSFEPILELQGITALTNSTLLADGSAYLFGGYWVTNYLQTFEPVNPFFGGQYSDSSRTVAVDPKPHLRAGTYLASLTTLLNGRVLIAGGSTDPYGFDAASDLDIYNPSDRSYRRLAPLPQRLAHEATLLPDGSVLFTGGWGQVSFSDSWIFDPISESLRVGPMLEAARSYHTSTLLPDGSILLVGGVLDKPSAEILQLPGTAPAPEIQVLVAGDFLEIYTTGIAVGSKMPPFVMVGKQLAQIVYFGPAPGWEGLQQINVRIPEGTSRGEPVAVQINYLNRPSNRAAVQIP